MKLAIFDLDGTLIDSLADIAEAANYSLKKLGFPTHELSKFNYFVGNGLLELINRILPENAKDKVDEALFFYKEFYSRNYMVKTCVYDGIAKMLETLGKNGIKLAVASNKTDEFTQNVVKHYFGDEIFAMVCGRIESRPTKPNPDILHDIMHKLGFSPEECFMIGDTYIDIQTGKNAGVKTIGCLWGFRTLEELADAGADFIARMPEDIVKFVCE